jgi:rhamnose transport system permease protein
MTLLESPASTGRHSADPRWRRLAAQRELSLIAVLVVLVLVFSLLNGRFASWATAAQVLNDMSIVVIVGAGLALVLLTRNIDVSVGSMVGLTAYLAATFSVEHPRLPMVAVIGYSCLIGLVLGSINGLIVATLRVPSIMVTLGTLYVYRGVDSAIAGSSQVTAQALPGSYNGVASWSLFGLPGMIIYAAVIAGALWFFLRHTLSGRALRAIGSNPEAAEKLGIPAKRWIFIAFAVSGVLCGFAGVLWGARYGTVNSSVASGYEIVALAAVVVGGVSVNGGVGSIGGVVVGAAVLSVISTGLALVNVSQFWLQAIQGTVIVAALVTDYLIRNRVHARGVTA